jgi:hypothetical protein
MTREAGMVLMLVLLCSVVSISWFFIRTGMAFKKFNRLDKTVQSKLLLLDYYMVAVRNLSNDELIKLSALPGEALEYMNTLHQYDEQVKCMRENLR